MLTEAVYREVTTEPGVTFTELGRQSLRGVVSALLCYTATPSSLSARLQPRRGSTGVPALRRPSSPNVRLVKDTGKTLSSPSVQEILLEKILPVRVPLINCSVLFAFKNTPVAVNKN